MKTEDKIVLKMMTKARIVASQCQNEEVKAAAITNNGERF